VIVSLLPMVVQFVKERHARMQSGERQETSE